MNANHTCAPVPQRLGLYPDVDSLVWLVRILDAGIKTVQLRIKKLREPQVAAEIEAAVMLGRRYEARVFINDYWQLAMHYGAYGVHLGQDDMYSADATAIRNAGLRLGLSAHDKTEIVRALVWQPSYIAIGHIFPTTTKVMTSDYQGLEQLQQLVTELPPIPTVAIGGISCEQVEAVLMCGVGSVAVVSAITSAPDWRQAIYALQSIIAQQHGSATIGR